MATEGLTSVAAPSLIDLSKKGEDPVTRAYYQLTHEIANNGAVMERGDSQRSGAVFYQIEAEPDKHREKTHFSIDGTGKKNTEVLSRLPQLLLFDFKFTRMKYLYSSGKLFQRLPFPLVLCLLHPD